MKVDYSHRGAGKTTRLIKWLSQSEDRILITINHDEENRLKREYPTLAHRIVDWQSYLDSKGRHASIKTLGIDNADIILQRMLDKRIDIVSMSIEELEQ